MFGTSTGSVYLHATRSGLSQSTSLLWAGSVGAVSFAEFLFADTVGNALHRRYLKRLRPVPVATSPYEGVVL